ncbi:SDR family oxidoreductase [Novosphingobium sp. fls2-241-R2A-195]|jgi:NAD(P)-dependent dehydrogenase (short-subunit alcohol dehydrogenase family)|uniref:SDR family NAD(P)-dependent oxidoreductase n=1 Tax=Novosphingobium sp. fls2-241-R2A-195 TaxID=3040296 RepID=UPI00254C1942|nr:SDR family oxidoreductase [Novosphingobium sp. fls2-241-R2A-195]
MDLGLKGLKAILVGANGGIGRVVAHVLSAEGCDIAICGRSQDKVDNVLSEVAASGVKTYGEALDVTQVEAVPAFVDKAAEALGGCDIFISFTSTNLGEDTDAAWEAVIQADILPMRRGIAAARPHLAKSDNAAIVCFSSTGAVEEFMGVQPYNALKAAVMNYSSSLAQALAGEGIRVNCITPGPVLTEDGPWPKIQAAMPDFYNATLANMPSGRFTTGEELANAVAFVVSPACKAMTGANIVVDNGYTKRTQF